MELVIIALIAVEVVIVSLGLASFRNLSDVFYVLVRDVPEFFEEHSKNQEQPIESPHLS